MTQRAAYTLVPGRAHLRSITEASEEIIARSLQRATSGPAALWDDANVTTIQIGGGASQTTITIGLTGQTTVVNGFISCPGVGTNSQRFGLNTSVSGANSVVVGEDITCASDNVVAIGRTITLGSTVSNSVVIGRGAALPGFGGSVVIGPAAVGSNDGVTIGADTSDTGQHNITIGANANSLNEFGVAIGDLAISNGYAAIGIGPSANASANQSIALGGHARNHTIDQITHVVTATANSFVAGHLKYEITNFYGGAGIRGPETTGRYAQPAPNFRINGTGGQLWTTILEPKNFTYDGSAPTAVGTVNGAGTLIGGSSYQVAIGYVNKERNGETMLTSPYTVTLGGGDNAILIQNLAAGIIDAQVEEILVYIEWPIASGNFYMTRGVLDPWADVTLIGGPPNFDVPGYLGYPGGGEVVTLGRVTTPDTSAQVTSNTTASVGTGWTLEFAGGDSDDAAQPGGDISFFTNKTGTAHSLTKAGFFRASDGAFELSGATSGAVGFIAPAVAGSTTYTLPSADGTAGQMLSTDGAATLSWATPGGVTPVWTKYTVPYSSFTAIANTESITLFTLAAGGVIHGVKIKHSTAFSGGALSAYDVSVGIAGNEQKYAPNFDVFQATGATTYDLTSDLGGEDHGATTAILITATSVGDTLDQVAAGSVDVWVLTSTAV